MKTQTKGNNKEINNLDEQLENWVSFGDFNAIEIEKLYKVLSDNKMKQKMVQQMQKLQTQNYGYLEYNYKLKCFAMDLYCEKFEGIIQFY